MKLRFTSKRLTGVTKVNTGIGNYTVDIPFVPNFIDLTFFDQKNKRSHDTITFVLAAVPTGYTLTVNYDVGEPREIRHVVAKLPVDPEQTISH